MAETIYLDYQATTPLAPEALAAMEPWLRDGFANPHSSHAPGRAAAAAVAVAREQVADLLPAGGRLVFTSGATEAINMALGAVKPLRAAGRDRVLVAPTEHAAVLDTAGALARDGFALQSLAVDAGGLVGPDTLSAGFDDRTALVAVMQVNNEIGVIQPVAAISEAAHGTGALFLCDAVQGFGRIAAPENADLIAISAHKIHGPKGIGALWIRDGVDVPPLIHGGGQEMGMRSGTLSPALCAGFGAAAQLAKNRMTADAAHVERLGTMARALFAGWQVNGSTAHRYPGNLNIRREGLDVSRLMSDVRDVAFSSGSACASGSGRPSHVLKALGLSSAAIKSSIRLGFGRYTTEVQLTRAAERINQAAEAQGL
ncbi:MAG: cysteine desulfurase family protein [Parasphingorhabdus sp.]|nr:cysteine desulfurase family protein [Parasphingorhabdus sp.]